LGGFFTDRQRDMKTTGMNPKACFGNQFRSKLLGIIPSAVRDCSSYQFPYTSLWKLEFHV
jgi:hypothetical protein